MLTKGLITLFAQFCSSLQTCLLWIVVCCNLFFPQPEKCGWILIHTKKYRWSLFFFHKKKCIWYLYNNKKGYISLLFNKRRTNQLYWVQWTPFWSWSLMGTNARQKTYEIFHAYCIFCSGFMCQTTVNFGITKDGSHVLNILASWNCFTCRNLFQNGANDMSECLTCETAFCKKAQNFE